jgi:quinoprotein dehydrogenase-associated probable ABC transporter substrate-binding protein
MPAWAERARAAVAALALAGLAAAAGPASAQTFDLVSKKAFRVCADPANMPFSNEAEEGFENEIAELFAERLGLPVQYEWYPMATGFIRNTLADKKCDVVIGYAQGHEMVLNTNHYYVSAYALVVPEDGPLAGVETLGDAALRGTRLGVVAGSPPASHLARHGLIGKAKPYALMVDRRHESPNEDMIADLVAGEIDGALMWGPIGGWMAQEADAGLKVIPLINETETPRLFYRITMGVRQGELVWKRELNSLIRRNQEEIDRILASYGVPLLEDFGGELKVVGQ